MTGHDGLEVVEVVGPGYVDARDGKRIGGCGDGGMIAAEGMHVAGLGHQAAQAQIVPSPCKRRFCKRLSEQIRPRARFAQFAARNLVGGDREIEMVDAVRTYFPPGRHQVGNFAHAEIARRILPSAGSDALRPFLPIHPVSRKRWQPRRFRPGSGAPQLEGSHSRRRR